MTFIRKVVVRDRFHCSVRSVSANVATIVKHGGPISAGAATMVWSDCGVNFGLCNVLCPVQNQAITQTENDSLSVES